MMQADIDLLRRWIGRSEEAEELLTLGTDMDELRDGDPAPLGIHWCLGMTTSPAAELGPDGHPALGGFLPPVPFARRMWAGGVIRTVRPPRIGAEVRRRSCVASIAVKEGRSGRLCFVAVDHAYCEQDEVIVSERHHIVYRDPASTGQARPALRCAPARLEISAASIQTTPTLLFRYSALTFNGHRIHYDLPYAQEVEGYGGLVVHGPLQATWMLHAAARIAGHPPREFTFRGVQPLICVMEWVLACGGVTVRTGLEDNIRIDRSRLAAGNRELAQCAAASLARHDCRPATAAEARAMPGLASQVS